MNIKQNSDFTNAKVGDKVWSIEDGDTEILAVLPPAVHEGYPIKVNCVSSYTIDGKEYNDSEAPSLFHKKPVCFDEATEYAEVSSCRDCKFWERKQFEFHFRCSHPKGDGIDIFIADIELGLIHKDCPLRKGALVMTLKEGV